jgi:5-methylcytosine-specific restriction endonuclease McrA
MPIAKGGTNFIDNLQWLCPKCNLQKGAKDPIVFAQEKGLV